MPRVLRLFTVYRGFYHVLSCYEYHWKHTPCLPCYLRQPARTLVELRKYENRRKAKDGHFLPMRRRNRRFDRLCDRFLPFWHPFWDPSCSRVIDCFASYSMFSFEIKTATKTGSIAGRFAGRTTKTSNQLHHRVFGSRCSHLCGMNVFVDFP